MKTMTFPFYDTSARADAYVADWTLMLARRDRAQAKDAKARAKAQAEIDRLILAAQQDEAKAIAKLEATRRPKLSDIRKANKTADTHKGWSVTVAVKEFWARYCGTEPLDLTIFDPWLPAKPTVAEVLESDPSID